MYHCHVHFYLLGRQSRTFEIMKGMPPLEHFAHEYMESSEPEQALAAKADVIIADLHGRDAGEAVKALIQAKSKEAELIVLADKEQIGILTSSFTDIKDIWICPMTDEEICFRFLR